MGVEGSRVVECVIPEEDWGGIWINAKKAELAFGGIFMDGKSQIRDTVDREKMLAEDQLIGQIANYAGSVVLTGSPSGYWLAREIANDNPSKGDGGTDIIGLDHVDIKGRMLRHSPQPLDYKLLVRPQERHQDGIYVLVMVPKERPYKAFVVGWAKDSDFPDEPYDGPIEALRGAYDIEATNLRKIDDLRDSSDDSEYYWDQIYGEDYLYLTTKQTYDQCAFCGGFNVHSEPCKELQHEWNVMDFGKHKGQHIDDVPSGYLEFLIVKGIRSARERKNWLETLQSRDNKYLSPRWEQLAANEDS